MTASGTTTTRRLRDCTATHSSTNAMSRSSTRGRPPASRYAERSNTMHAADAAATSVGVRVGSATVPASTARIVGTPAGLTSIRRPAARTRWSCGVARVRSRRGWTSTGTTTPTSRWTCAARRVSHVPSTGSVERSATHTSSSSAPAIASRTAPTRSGESPTRTVSTVCSFECRGADPDEPTTISRIRRGSAVGAGSRASADDTALRPPPLRARRPDTASPRRPADVRARNVAAPPRRRTGRSRRSIDRSARTVGRRRSAV